jgi:hypothetical protein
MFGFSIITMVERIIFLYALCKAIKFFVFKWEEFYLIFEFLKKMTCFICGGGGKEAWKVYFKGNTFR